MQSPPAWLHWLSILLAVLVAVGYFVRSERLDRLGPEGTVRSRHARLRRAWLAEVHRQPGGEILAVQTIRNSLMSASFLASSLMIALMATLGVTAGSLPALGAGVLADPPALALLPAAKALLLAVTLGLAFGAFVLSVRLYHHLGYMVVLENEERTADYLDRAGGYFGAGLRIMPFAAAALAGFVSTPCMPLAAAGVALALARFDRG
jgi:uncharacterized membrane protein